MEPTTLSSLLIGAGTIAVSAVVALIVGRRRGLDQVEAQADSELKKLVDAQAQRLALQDIQISELRAQVAALQAQVTTLKSELDVEKRISLRFRDANGNGGKA